MVLWANDLVFKNLSRFKVTVGIGTRIAKLSSRSSKSLKLFPANIALKDGVYFLLKAAEEIYVNNTKGLKNFLDDLDHGGYLKLKCLEIKHCYEMEYIIDTKKSAACVVFPSLRKLEIGWVT